MLIVTSISASVLAFLLVKLSLNVILLRRKYDVSVGDGGRDSLYRAIRAQGNLIEYAPIALILLGCLELNQGSHLITTTLASMFVIGRIMHPLGIKSAESPWQFRTLGMVFTLLSILMLGLLNIAFIVKHVVLG